MAYDKTKLFKNGLPNSTILGEMYADASDDLSSISANWDIMDAFYDGNQWDSIMGHSMYGGETLYNSKGKTVYGKNLAKQGGNKGDDFPKRTVNKYKSIILSTVAMFSEVDPMPNVYSLDSYEYDSKKLDKPNLVLYNGFRLENDFKEIYSNIVTESIQRGYSILHMYEDKENATTEIPIKFGLIDTKDFLVDSHATSIETAQFIIVKEKMRNWEFKERYIISKKAGSKMPTQKENDMDVVEIFNYWIKIGKSMWSVISTYEDAWIRLKGKNGKAIKNKHLIKSILPFIVYRPVNSKMWYAPSIAVDAIDVQIDLNKTRSEYDYSWMKYIDPPVGLDGVDSKSFKAGNIPGGSYSLTPTARIIPQVVPLIPEGAAAQRLAIIEGDMSSVFGNQELFQGRNPSGTYSAVHLQTLMALQQMKPKMFEDNYFKAIKATAKLYLIMVSKSISSKLSLFNPTTQKDVKVSRDDIDVLKFKFDIRVQDQKLMTPQKRFDNLMALLQYMPGLVESIGMSNVAKLANSAVSNFFSEDIVKKLEDEDALKNDIMKMTLEAEKKKMEQPEQQPAQGNASPPTGTEGEPPPSALPDEVTLLADEINTILDENNGELRASLDAQGLDPQPIELILKNADEAGTPPEQLSKELTAVKDMILNIKSDYNQEA